MISQAMRSARSAVARSARQLSRLTILAVTIGCSRAPESSTAQASGALASSNSQVSQSRQNAITAAVAKVAPSVVTVQTEVIEQSPQDPFDMLFGRAQPRTQAGLGTGFVVRKEGVIVTNAHVVSGANKVSVMARDGTVYPARVLGADETNDIAVLKIDAKNLTEVKLGNSNNLAIGEWAIAIGNPYGFYLGNSEPSVSVGVVSATQRNLVGGGPGFRRRVDVTRRRAGLGCSPCAALVVQMACPSCDSWHLAISHYVPLLIAAWIAAMLSPMVLSVSASRR